MISLKRMIVFMLCLNLGCWMIVQLFPQHAPFTPMIPVNYEEVESTIRGLGASDPTGFVALMIGYVWLGFVKMVEVFGWALFGFPALLISLGVPSVVSYPILALWATLFMLGVLEFLSGRSA